MFDTICEIVKSLIAFIVVVGFIVLLPTIIVFDFIMIRFF